MSWGEDARWGVLYVVLAGSQKKGGCARSWHCRRGGETKYGTHGQPTYIGSPTSLRTASSSALRMDAFVRLVVGATRCLCNSGQFFFTECNTVLLG